MKSFVLVVIMLIVSLSLALAVAAQDAQTPAELCAAALPAPDPATREYSAPEQVLEPGVDYRAILCTDAGPVYVDLLEDYTPVTVNSFVFLAENGYYNNTVFHRVIEDFMAQGGDPTATGRGGPGYQFEDEFVGFLNFDVPGWLAMANAGPGTNGSQFFITTVSTPHLDYRHTIFGEVLDGQENVLNIQLRDPDTATTPGTALQTVLIITDPATVETTYTAPEPATQDEVVAAFEAVQAVLPAGVLTVNATASGLVTTEVVVAAAPEAAQTELADFLARHNHLYRVANVVDNAQCDLTNIDFMSIGYTLDVFETREDAAAALADPEMQELPLKLGYTERTESENLMYPLYTTRTTSCNVEAVQAMTYWQRGHFVALVELTVPATSESVPFLDLSLSQGVGLRIYEPLLAGILRREIRTQ